MKKIIALLLTVLLCLTLCACGGNNNEAPAENEKNDSSVKDDSFIEIGEEIVTDNFTFTINEIGFSDDICIEKGDTLGLYSKQGDSVQAKDGYGWLYYSVSYKFKGKEELAAQGQFLASIQYGDNYFMTPNLRFFKYDGAWHGLDYQWGSGGSSLGLPLPATDMLYKYDPWVEKDYELHGAVQVPVKAVEDKETPMVLRFDFSKGNNNYDQVKCNVEIKNS